MGQVDQEERLSGAVKLVRARVCMRLRACVTHTLNFRRGAPWIRTTMSSPLRTPGRRRMPSSAASLRAAWRTSVTLCGSTTRMSIRHRAG